MSVMGARHFGHSTTGEVWSGAGMRYALAIGQLRWTNNKDSTFISLQSVLGCASILVEGVVD
jgi:hypothetical protein